MASAPGQLALVERFVNSEAATPAELGAWLAEHGLAETSGSWSETDAQRAVALREGLRELLLANNGVAPDPAAAARVEEVARAAPLAVSVDPPGLEPLGDGIAAPLGRLLAIVAAAQADGSWTRLKACRAEDCRWAFFDASRNRSRTWCSMSVCGNRAKARAYRARH
jgi:predicted RNA-binding Zn ribbon-like protein